MRGRPSDRVCEKIVRGIPETFLFITVTEFRVLSTGLSAGGSHGILLES